MFGMLVKNDGGNLLISSEAETLNCLGSCVYDSLLQGPLYDFPNYASDDGANTLSGRCIHRYRISSTVAPLFFIKPTDYSNFYGILQQFNSGNTWYVDVLQAGRVLLAPIVGQVLSVPTVLAFVPTSKMPAPAASYGMATFLPNGRRAFDSRLSPLAIYNATSVIPPTIPCDGGQPTNQDGFAWNDSTLDFNFHCDNTYNSYAIGTDTPLTNMMFSAPSVAQAVYSRQKNGYKYSRGNYGGQGHWSTAVWWAMYHQSYRLQTGAIHAGWGVYAAGYWFSSTWENAGWYNGGGGSGSIQAGDRPFNDKTINLSANTIMVADASKYI